MLPAIDFTLPNHFGLATYPPGASFGPRAMQDYEFVWIVEGSAVYQWGERAFEAPEGSVVLCRPGAVDRFTWDPERSTRHGYFHFSFLRRPIDIPPESHWPFVRQPEEDDILRPLFRHLLSWNGRGSPNLVRLTIANLLYAFVLGESGMRPLPSEPLPQAVERAWRFIQETLEKDPAAPISLEDLASAATVTPEHLCRVFRKATGFGPVETVRIIRLDRALALVARSNYSIQEIAAMSGFVSPFHFSRSFRSVFGDSPSSIRARAQKGEPLPQTPLAKVRSLS